MSAPGLLLIVRAFYMRHLFVFKGKMRTKVLSRELKSMQRFVVMITPITAH